MRDNYVLKNQINRAASNDAVIKASLLEFKNALFQEQYEKCADLIVQAKAKGVTQKDIEKVITRHLRGITQGVTYEAPKKQKYRKRF